MRLSLLALLLAAMPAAAQPAERIYTNATFWTGRATGFAEALAVRGDRILAVGTQEAVMQHRGEGTQVVDLEGGFVVPGFVDAHVHFLSGGFQLASVDLRAAQTPEEFVARLRDFAQTQPPGTWITGGDWDHEAWGGELPRRDWIDSVSTEHYVFVNRLDGHMALVNTRVLELAGITDETPSPAGGEIVRDARGATGILKDEAMSLVYRVQPEPDEALLDAAFDRGQQHSFAHGVTQVHDVGSFGGWTDLATFERARDTERLKLRVYSIVPLASWERMAARVSEQGRGDAKLWWGGLKGFVDGSLGSTTAWFYDPYDDAPQTSGLLTMDTTAFERWIVDADRAGLHLAIHAIGDRANDWLLDRFAEARATNGERDRRFRVEHAQHLTREAIRRFGAEGVIPSMQPYHAIDDGRWAEKRIGPERIRTTYAFRSLLDAGAPLAFGSDWTVAPLVALEALYAAITRRTLDGANPEGWVPEEKITLEEALHAHTLAAAYAGFREADTGTLEAGKLADFVVLSRNLLETPPEALPELRVMRTFVGGEEVYRAD